MPPAIEHDFQDEPLPPAVVLDADFVVSVLHEGEEYHADCIAFAVRLLNEKIPIVYSQLLRLEFMSAWQSAVRRRGVPASVLPRQARLFDELASVRAELYKVGEAFLPGLLNHFMRYEVRLSARLQSRAREHMASYNLRPLDACLVASAFQTGVPHIASLDGDLRRVDDLHLWNGHVPARRNARKARRR